MSTASATWTASTTLLTVNKQPNACTFFLHRHHNHNNVTKGMSLVHLPSRPNPVIHNLTVLQPPIMCLSLSALTQCWNPWLSLGWFAVSGPWSQLPSLLSCSGPLPPGRGEGWSWANATAQHQLAFPARQSGPVCQEAAGHPTWQAVCVLLCQLRVRRPHTPPRHTGDTWGGPHRLWSAACGTSC